MMDGLEIQRLEAAGGVIFRVIDSQFEVALCAKGKLWVLPKGLIEPDETVEEAALREVREETGLCGDIAKKIGEINYDFIGEKHYFKTVHYYLMRHTGGSLHNHDLEVDKVEWFPISEAQNILTYVLDKETLRKAERMLDNIIRSVM